MNQTSSLRGEAFILSQVPREPSRADTRFAAADGFELSGIVVREPRIAPRANLVINSATGVPKEFYLRFARRAAREGYQVLVYDYRGIGGSKPSSLRGFEARMRDWGRLDMPAALDHLAARGVGLPNFVIGHSVGGQLLGLLPNHGKIRAAALIACSTGYWGDMPPAYGAFCALLWYGVIPVTTSLFGYAPAKKLHLGEDLPLGVAKEWGEWCKRREYFAPLKTDGGNYFFNELRFPIMSLSFTDDPIANPSTVAALHSAYTSVKIESEFVAPSDVGRHELGHLGFFSQKSEEGLWKKPLSFFERHIS